jgi:isopentenyl phosphate kinase
MENLFVIKVGGSVITDRASDVPKINYENLEKVASEIGKAYKAGNKRMVLVHGAGSYGHPIVKRTGIHNGIDTIDQVHAFAETQRLQNHLNSIVTRVLMENGVPAIPYQASSNAVMEDGKIVSIDTEAIKGFLKVGLVPVLFGVPSYDKKQGCSILSGDVLAPYIGKRLEASKIIHITDVNGIFSGDPKKDENAKQIPLVTRENLEEVMKSIAGSTNTDVTGGMQRKLAELLDMDIDSQIVSYMEDDVLERAISGENVGTIIRVK